MIQMDFFVKIILGVGVGVQYGEYLDNAKNHKTK